MRAQLATILTLAAVTLAAPAQAGELGLFGSYWDTDALDDTAGAGVKYAIGDAALRLELRGSFYPDVSSDARNVVQGETGDLELEAVVPEVGVAYNFAPGANTQFYVGGGLSYYLLDTNKFDIDDEAGYYGLAGFTIGGGGDGPAFFAEAIYRSVEATVNDDSLVREVDLDLSGPSVNLGVIFRF